MKNVKIVTVVHDYLQILEVFLPAIHRVLNQVPSVEMILIDNGSSSEIKQFLAAYPHSNQKIVPLPQNIGKAHAVNQIMAAQPELFAGTEVLVSVDPDVLFPIESFKALVEATLEIPRVGMLGMRYEKNRCNPERNLFFPARKFKDPITKKQHFVYKPFMMNVPGCIFSVPWTCIQNELNGKLYPVLKPELYFPDDWYLYDFLNKKKYVCGYLKGTTVSHLKSGEIYLV